jgi:hypothetical protein
MNVLELCDREIAAVPLEATVADAINKIAWLASSLSAMSSAKCRSPAPTRKPRRSAIS